MVSTNKVDESTLSVSGRFIRVAKIKHEPYDICGDVEGYINFLRAPDRKVDLFSFMQPISDTERKHPYYCEHESLAVVPISSYERWWKSQINDKTRNLIRKSQKGGVEIEICECDERFVKGVKGIYDESPIRQGKPFSHFQKPPETLASELGTFPGRSTFVGAYYSGELIGFAKIVVGTKCASLMHIIAKISSRNKAPTNALIAKAVEICSSGQIPYLHYGVWSAGGLGMFKQNHAFERRDVPRYFVPFTRRGRLMLRCGLTRSLGDRVPVRLRSIFVNMRNKWYNHKYRGFLQQGAVAQ